MTNFESSGTSEQHLNWNIYNVMICILELDMHCITERIAAMSYPADGIESAFKNHIDDISATIESKHSNKVC